VNDELTDREEEVVELLVQGKNTKEIAEILWIAVATARNHVGAILRKLGVNSRLAAVAAWREHQTDPAGRVLGYCRRARIKLTPLQRSLIKAAFSAEQIHCEGGNHRWVQPVRGEPWTCLCGAIKVDSA
jgi:DNA-binding CsgD family transcriptional regulator